ncbi:fimbrial protein [Pseudomonas fluorescens]|uniref:Fimbrial protein n=1 Tax=Pseudomonas fluorescens TaxID=294 RepID=A0A379ID10_PSEFL|nr:fimbrial protein [Pseudomonas fluorescens]AIG00967.1 hypothetical protein HZ99_01800 [Pseudomonas fluorescens]SUD30581.1 fimbrial protein [Pseudomonas fluorescens]
MTFTLNTVRNLGCLLLALCWSQAGFSMTCTTALGANTEALNMGPTKVSMAQVKAGAEIWRSATITRQFMCYDTPRTLNLDTLSGFFFLDPLITVAGLDPSLEIGVTYKGRNTRASYGSRINIGQAVNCTPFCDPGNSLAGLNRYYALPVTVAFQVYVKLTGIAPPGSGKIANASTFTVLKLAGSDDKFGSLPASNFATTLSGLNGVSFMSCQPTITVAGNNGAAIDFGSVSSKDFVAGKIGKQVPFSVNVNMSGAENGQACPGSTMQATFSTTHTVRNQTTIMPSSNSRFGIVVSRAATPLEPIVMNKVVDLALVNGSLVQNRFMAGIQWLTASPLVGPFSASATVDITFK